MIITKLPIMGRVKTRLARDVGIAEATRFYRTTSRTIISRLGRQPFWQTYLAISPDRCVATRMLPAGIRRMGQGGGDLGARMHRPMRCLPPGPVCVIGTDIPAIRIEDIRAAFRSLGNHDAVFGPAEDGGFWLVGLRRRPRLASPYEGVRWSRADTLACVEANLRHLVLARTTRHHDVDTGVDLARSGGHFGRLIPRDP
ncbi:TIGR04282 family arsenosugar biosynthesis glycosyltransferase [Pseudorhodoplanes sp.]|uniref:TIGR04282 family arsenosugar biosynthesis glycosyltransferase n=1 Tax=Pseudorhodoplanes sp. TaxID=1934341 RepID=UPI003D0B464F